MKKKLYFLTLLFYSHYSLCTFNEEMIPSAQRIHAENSLFDFLCEQEKNFKANKASISALRVTFQQLSTKIEELDSAQLHLFQTKNWLVQKMHRLHQEVYACLLSFQPPLN